MSLYLQYKKHSVTSFIYSMQIMTHYLNFLCAVTQEYSLDLTA